jgi:hypothetical protein
MQDYTRACHDHVSSRDAHAHVLIALAFPLQGIQKATTNSMSTGGGNKHVKMI